MRLLAAAVAAVLGLCVLVAVAGASHQTAKNGCTSSGVPSGTLVTPAMDIDPNTFVNLNFLAWFEIESVNPADDTVAVDLTRDGGQTWVLAQNLTPNPPPGGAADLPVSNQGFQATPAWTTYTINLNSLNVFNNPAVRFRFRFDSGTTMRQGFRGFAVDNVVITGTTVTPPLNENFEGGALPANWAGSGLWHVQAAPENVRVIPGINPELVTLPDAGFLPADQAGSNRHVAWFGEAATGTYCGADFAGAAELSLSPPTANLVSGQTHTVTATTTHAGGIVRFSVSGANSAAGAAAVPAGGSTTFSYAGANFGSDTITAFLDLNADGLQQPGEPGATSSAAWRARTVDDLADPEPFVDVNVQPVSGEVYVKLPAGTSRAVRAALAGPRPSQTGAPVGFIPLTQAGKIPVGSQLETTNGRVLVESAASQTIGAVQRAQFYFGRFTVLQRRAARPITDIVLKGGTFRGCPSTRSAGADTSQRRRSRRSRVRRVWGDGRGRFRTRGRYSSAAVRGTKWIVEDRCDGTLTRVARRPRSSRVVVRDFVRRRSVTVRAGRSYLAAKRR
jgi:hypothetical protein